MLPSGPVEPIIMRKPSSRKKKAMKAGTASARYALRVGPKKKAKMSRTKTKRPNWRNRVTHIESLLLPGKRPNPRQSQETKNQGPDEGAPRVPDCASPARILIKKRFPHRFLPSTPHPLHCMRYASRRWFCKNCRYLPNWLSAKGLSDPLSGCWGSAGLTIGSVHYPIG